MTPSRVVICGIALLTGAASAEEAPAFRSENEKVSYAIGADLGTKLRKMSLDVSPAMVSKGLEDALAGRKALLTEDEVRDAIAAMQGEMKAKQAARLAARAGEVYLTENRSKPGVTTLPSGLQYKVLRAGDGRRPSASDTVEYHYRGSFIDGTEFDSSYRRGQPTILKLDGAIIRGWTEALQLMPVGSRWQVFIPPQLAYGERGTGTVGPNATVIFELELLAVK